MNNHQSVKRLGTVKNLSIPMRDGNKSVSVQKSSMSALNLFKKNFSINYLEEESELPFKKPKK